MIDPREIGSTPPNGGVRISSNFSDLAAPSGSALPIPRALYPCNQCFEECSWPAQDLYWSEKAKMWICAQCWSDEDYGERGTSLAEEINRQKP